MPISLIKKKDTSGAGAWKNKVNLAKLVHAHKYIVLLSDPPNLKEAEYYIDRDIFNFS